MDSVLSKEFELNRFKWEIELDSLFEEQWSSVFRETSDADYNVFTSAIDELSKKYHQLLKLNPNQKFVESQLGKLHILCFVGELISLFPARNLNYENNWPLSATFDSNLSGFYVDEISAVNVLNNAIHPESSYKQVWKSVFKLVGLGHFKAQLAQRRSSGKLTEHHEDSDLENVSLSGKTKSIGSSVDDIENVTPVDEFYQANKILPFSKPHRVSDNSSSYTAVSPRIKKRIISTERDIYCVDELLYKQTGICVRGETLWAIRSPEGTSFLLRDIWQDEEELFKEVELYRKAQLRNASNIASLVHTEFVMIPQDGKIVDSSWYGIRKCLSIPLSQRKLVNVDNDDGLIVYQTRKPPKSLKNVPEFYVPRNPTHFRQVFEFMKPLSHATGLQGIFYGFRDAIKGHQSLAERAGILHRNISPKNIMISQDEKIGYLYGLNGALEYQPLDSSNEDWEWGYISLRAFVAMELLHTKVYVEHNFYHDLESFFWSFIWEAVHNNGPLSARQECVELDCWNTMTCKDLCRAKLAIASNNEFFEELMTRKITDFFKPSLPYIRKLRNAVFIESPNYYDPKLYEWMIRILDDALRDFQLGRVPERCRQNDLAIDTSAASAQGPPFSPISPISPQSSRILRTKSLRMSRQLISPTDKRGTTSGTQRYPSYLRRDSAQV